MLRSLTETTRPPVVRLTDIVWSTATSPHGVHCRPALKNVPGSGARVRPVSWVGTQAAVRGIPSSDDERGAMDAALAHFCFLRFGPRDSRSSELRLLSCWLGD